MLGILKKIFKIDSNERKLKQLRPIVQAINQMEEEISKLSDDELARKTVEFKEKLKNGASLDDILIEAFATVREVSKRTLGLRHFDVQLMGGIVLHQGNIAEMKTGEGKTLVATLPAYLNALTGEGVHIVTVNDYLAKRDAEWMGPIYKFLGLSVGVIYSMMDYNERKKAYQCDITYGTNTEFGFDYLRDNMAVSEEFLVQRGHNYAIVDEVDSILIDEARTPLIISGPSEEDVKPYIVADKIARKLKKDIHFEVDEKEKNVILTEEGISKCEELLGVPDLFSEIYSDMAHKIVQALKAHYLFKRDVDYVVKDGQIIIVDEFTGRLMYGRRYSDGLHQAIEAKERVKIGEENQTLATITLQNYFRMYKKLAGMTGTAATEAEEFKEIYGLDVVVIPTHKPMIRVDHPDVIYKTKKEKFKAVVDEIEECYKRGQPVLVGTTSIENSEYLSRLLKARKIPHQVLNAKYHEKEAKIVAQAGRFKAVTIATNMAGRGTDILLGGNAEFLAKEKALTEGIDPEKDKERYQQIYLEFKKQCEEERKKVIEVGGLHIIGTERHESRRIDNQLRGRSGRQGDPGSSRFYLSLEDDLLRLFGSDRIHAIMNKIGVGEGEAIEHPLLSKAIESAQKKVEEMHFEIRKRLLAYDNVLNKQREAIYTERKKILLEKDKAILRCLEVVESCIEDLIDEYILQREDEPNPEGLRKRLKQIFDPEIAEIVSDDIDSQNALEYKEKIFKAVKQKLEAKFNQLGKEVATDLVRGIMLHTVDTLWREHLLAMDELRQGIGLRAIGQKDPLLEYQFESYNLFQQMLSNIRRDISELVYKVKIVEDESIIVKNAPSNRSYKESRDWVVPIAMTDQTPEASVAVEQGEVQPKPYKRKTAKIGRNDPCPCGSGKKYKHCCGKNR